MTNRLFRKFQVHYHALPPQSGIVDILFKNKIYCHNPGSFGIFNSELIEKIGRAIFNEMYVNGMEDIDLALRLRKMKVNTAFINYKIGEEEGASLGSLEIKSPRAWRHRWNQIYLNYKVEKGDVL